MRLSRLVVFGWAAGFGWVRIVVVSWAGLGAGRRPGGLPHVASGEDLGFGVVGGLGVEGAQGGKEGSIQGPDLAADAAVVAENGEEIGGVPLLVGARVRGGEHLIVEAGGQRDGVRAMDAEVGAAGDEAGEAGVLEVVGGCALSEVEGEAFPVFGEGDFAGVEAVPGVVARGTALAFRGTRAGGFARVGAVGGEAFFGEREFGHGYLLRFRDARLRLAAWKERPARVRSARAAWKAGSSWSWRQARTVRM